MQTGKFITFEGGEGAGKSTQAGLLAGTLAKSGIEVLLSREPGGSPGAEEIRQLLVLGAPDRWGALSEALLHFAARADHLEKTVRPALHRGAWVICDRFADSTLAYQGYGRGLESSAIEALTRLVVGDLQPDLTLILDLAVEDGLQRAAQRAQGEGAMGEGAQGKGAMGEGEDRYERMDAAFHARLRDGFRTIAKQNPARCVLLDAAASVAEVQAEIGRIVAEKFSLGRL